MTANVSEQPSLASGSPRWFAVRTKRRCEVLAQEGLQRRAWSCCLPVSQSPRQADPSLLLGSLLFPGFLFCRMCESQRLSALAVPGVVQVLGGEKCSAAEQAEVDILSAILSADVVVEPVAGTPPGRPVRFEDGLLRGASGVVMEVRGQSRLILPVQLIARWYAVDLDQLRLRPAAHPAAQVARHREVA